MSMTNETKTTALQRGEQIEEVAGELVQDQSKALIPAPQQLAQWHPVVAQDWEESERGWGTRPDGYTLHLTVDDRDAYVKAYYAKHNNLDEAPDCYTRTYGSPKLIDVGPETYAKLKAPEAVADRGMWGPKYQHSQYNPHSDETNVFTTSSSAPKSKVLP